MNIKSLLEFFPTNPTDPLYIMIKQLRLGSPGGSYVMIEESVVVSFHNI